jgi:hypothetical protein
MVSNPIAPTCHLRAFRLFQLPFRLPIRCIVGTDEFFQHSTLSLKLVGFEAVGVSQPLFDDTATQALYQATKGSCAK